MATIIRPNKPKTEEDVFFDQRESFDSLAPKTQEEVAEGLGPIRKRGLQLGSALGQAGLESPLVGASQIIEELGGFEPGTTEALSTEFARDFPRRTKDIDFVGKGLELTGSGLGSAARTLAAVINPSLTIPVLTSFASEAFGQNLRETQNEDLSGTERVGLATANATAEFIFEGLGLKYLPREMQGFVKKGLTAGVVSGTEETLTTYVQNLIANYYREQNVTEGALDSFISGAIAGTVIGQFAHPSTQGIEVNTENTELDNSLTPDLNEKDPIGKEINANLKAVSPKKLPGDTPRQRFQNAIHDIRKAGVDPNAIRAEGALMQMEKLSLDQASKRLYDRFNIQRDIKDIRRQANKNVKEFNAVLEAKLINPNATAKDIAKITKVKTNRVQNIFKLENDKDLDIKVFSEGLINKMGREELDNLNQLFDPEASSERLFDPLNKDHVSSILDKIQEVDAIKNGTVVKTKDLAGFYSRVFRNNKEGNKYFSDPLILDALKQAGYTGIQVTAFDKGKVKKGIRRLGENDSLQFQVSGTIAAVSNPFKKYQSEFMGTGEGTQFFGWGWYSTHNYDIAINTYLNMMKRKNTEIFDQDGVKLEFNDTAYEVIKNKLMRLPDVMRRNANGLLIEELQHLIDINELMISSKTPEIDNQRMIKENEEYQSAIDLLSAADSIQTKPGKAYLNKLTLFKNSDTGPEDLIQYYFPLNQQTKEVQEGIKETVKELLGTQGESSQNINLFSLIDSLNIEALIPKVPTPPFVKNARALGMNLKQIQNAYSEIKNVAETNEINLITDRNAKEKLKELFQFDGDSTSVIDTMVENGTIPWDELRANIVRELEKKDKIDRNDAEKKLSLTLAKNGVLGVRYPPGTLTGGDKTKADKYHFVIFRDDDIHIDKQIEFKEGDTYIVDPEKGVGRVREGEEIQFQTSNESPQATQQEVDYLKEHLINTGLVSDIKQSKEQLYNDEGKPVNGFFDPNTFEVFLSPNISINTVGHEGGHAVYHHLKKIDPKHEIVQYVDKQADIMYKKFGISEDVDFWNAVGDLYYQRVMPKGLRQHIAETMSTFWNKAKGALGLKTVREKMIEGVVNRMVNSKGQFVPPPSPVKGLYRELMDEVFASEIIPPDVSDMAARVAKELKAVPVRKEKWTETEVKGRALISDEKAFAEAWSRFTNGLALSPHEQYAVHRVINKKMIEDLKLISERGGEEFSDYLQDIVKFAKDTSYEAQSSIAGRSLAWQKTSISLIEAFNSLELMKKNMLPIEYQSVKKTILDITNNPYYTDYEKIERLEELAQRYKKIYEKDPNIYDALFSFMINNILSGISTQATNAISGALHLPLLIGDRFTQATLDSFRGVGKKDRLVFYRESLEMAKSVASLRGLRRGLKPFGEIWRHGKIVSSSDFDSFAPYVFNNYRDEIIHSTYLAIQRYLMKKGFKEETAAWIDRNLTAASRVLLGVDVLMKSVAAEAEMRAQIKAFSIRNNKPEVWKSFLNQQSVNGSASSFIQDIGKDNWKSIRQKAIKFADRTTFQDPPQKAIKNFIQFRDSLPGARYFVPFVNTLNNITKRALERVPGTGLVTIPTNIRRRSRLNKEELGVVRYHKAKKDSRTEVLDLLGKQIQGTVLSMMLLSMFDDDKLTGPPPKDEKEREMFYASKIPYGVKVGGSWISYRQAEPLATVLGIVAGFRDAMNRAEDAETKTEIFTDLAGTVGSVIIDSTWISSVTRHNDAKGIFETMSRMPSNFVPYSSFWRQMNKAVETWDTGEIGIRDTRGQELTEIGGESIVENFPFGPILYERLGGNIEKRINVWGKEIDVSNDVPMKWLMGGFAEFSGMDIRDVLDDPVETEMIDMGVYPSMPQKTVTVGKREIEVPDKVYVDWMLRRGELIKRVMREVINSPSYKRINDPEKRQLVLQTALNKQTEGLRRLLLSNMQKEIRDAF